MTTSKRPFCLSLGLLVAAGCSSSPSPEPASSTPLVRVDGRVVLLTGTERARLSPLELLDRVGRDVQRGRDDEAQSRAQRFGEVAEAALYAALLNPAADAANPGLRALASARAAQAGGDWPGLFASKAEAPERFSAFAAERAEVLAEGDADAEFSTASGMPLLELEAARVLAELARREGDTERAQELLLRGRELAVRHAPAQAAEFALVLAGGASSSWQLTADLALAPLRGSAPWLDPQVWSELLEREPVGAAWPADAPTLLAGQAFPEAPLERADDLAAEPTGALAWAAVGRLRAERGEHQTALLALRRAQASSRSTWVTGHLKLLQARALISLDQPAPASALLIGLADRREPDVAQAATALLGTLRLRNGQLRRGHGLLRQAVEEGSADSWPGLAEAEADLGLTYLALGNSDRGLHFLHAAQRRFQRAGALPQLRRSLKNELRYLDHAGDGERAEEVRDRCRRLGVDL